MMPVESPRPAPRRTTHGFVIGWFWAVFMSLLALGCFATGRPAAGLFAFLSAVVAWPPANELIARHWHVVVSEWVRLAIVVALLFPMGMAMTAIQTASADAGGAAAATDGSQITENAIASGGSIPGDLAQLAHVVAKAKSDYTEADNDLKKSVILRDRDVSAAAAVTGGSFANWPGTLVQLSTNDEGDAFIAVRLDDCDCSLKTWGNPYRDRLDHSLIRIGTPLFNKLLNMHKGDHVMVSGRFLEEGSMTEERSINAPEWIAQFSNVSPG